MKSLIDICPKFLSDGLEVHVILYHLCGVTLHIHWGECVGLLFLAILPCLLIFETSQI